MLLRPECTESDFSVLFAKSALARQNVKNKTMFQKRVTFKAHYHCYMMVVVTVYTICVTYQPVYCALQRFSTTSTTTMTTTEVYPPNTPTSTTLASILSHHSHHHSAPVLPTSTYWDQSELTNIKPTQGASLIRAKRNTRSITTNSTMYVCLLCFKKN